MRIVVGSDGNESYDEQKPAENQQQQQIHDDQFDYGNENEEIEVEIADGEEDDNGHVEADYTSDQGLDANQQDL